MQTTLFQQDHKNFIEVVRERVSLYGKEQASVQDLLAIIIGNKASIEACGELSTLSVRDLHAMTATDFGLIKGISKSVSERLEACIALSKKLAEFNLPEMEIIHSAEDAYGVFKYLENELQEHLVVAFLDTKNKVICRKQIFKGSLAASIVHPREIFKEAVKVSASSIIMAHNHPSGDCKPSNEDIDVTKKISNAGHIMGIELLDHLIIGENTYLSLKEKGYL